MLRRRWWRSFVVARFTRLCRYMFCAVIWSYSTVNESPLSGNLSITFLSITLFYLFISDRYWQSYERLTQAYLELAYHRMPKASAGERENSGLQQPIPANFQIRGLTALPLPIGTVDAPSPGAHDFATIQRFETSYDLVGGITCPKRLKCLGSDGRVYQQLLKVVWGSQHVVLALSDPRCTHYSSLPLFSGRG